MKFGVIVFPGSNCDDDMIHVLGRVMGADVEKIWHKETELKGYNSEDCIILPGGFSYGDYLRSGAIASFSPIMQSVIAFANNGGLVFGICNGFQVLCESKLLPGALLRNEQQKFICKNVYLKTENNQSRITEYCEPKQILEIPIAHADGRFFANAAAIKEMNHNKQVLFRYCTADGVVNSESNVNGSVDNIAGIMNIKGNVFGMMPHPERASEQILGNEDGRILFESLIQRKLILSS